MSFTTPWTLLFLWTLVPLVLSLWYARNRMNQQMRKFVGPPMISKLIPQSTFLNYWFRGLLLIASFVCMIFALAGPQFGVYFEDISRHGADIFVILDVSHSMLAEDVLPNRLDRAKSDIKDFMEQVVGDRVGLIAFAGRPIMLTPLTADAGFFLETLDKVDTETAPRGGTAIGDAIRLANRTFSQDSTRDRAILLITDGEDHDSFPVEAAKEAGAMGVKIFIVGLGDSTEGARIPLIDPQGNRMYMKYNGQEIWSKVDSELLREMAAQTHGAYIPVQTSAFDLGRIYVDHLSMLKHGEYEVQRRKQYRDRFQIFLMVAIGLQLTLLAIPESRFIRQGNVGH